MRIFVLNVLGSGGDIVVVPGIMCSYEHIQCTFGCDERSVLWNVEPQRRNLKMKSGFLFLTASSCVGRRARLFSKWMIDANLNTNARHSGSISAMSA